MCLLSIVDSNHYSPRGVPPRHRARDGAILAIENFVNRINVVRCSTTELSRQVKLILAATEGFEPPTNGLIGK